VPKNKQSPGVSALSLNPSAINTYDNNSCSNHSATVIVTYVFMAEGLRLTAETPGDCLFWGTDNE